MSLCLSRAEVRTMTDNALASMVTTLAKSIPTDQSLLAAIRREQRLRKKKAQ